MSVHSQIQCTCAALQIQFNTVHFADLKGLARGGWGGGEERAASEGFAVIALSYIRAV